MSILFSNEIIHAVNRELESAKESVRIITAYCKLSAINQLECHISDSINNKKLMIRFRLDDVVKGSTDFSVLEECLKRGWKVYIRFDLHAKTYIVDEKRGIVGSANATGSGLSINSSGNYEMATLVDVERQDLVKIEKLFNEAIEITDDLLDKLKAQFSQVEDLSANKKQITWGKDIINLFHPHVDTLFSYELPDQEEYSIGEYVGFLEDVYNGDADEMREKVRWSNAYIWLLDTLRKNGGCLYFGTLSALLHDTLVTDPKPYRKDVKVMLANLLSLISKLEMNEVVIDRPNYSQRITLVEN